jgi:glycosyltransferase involved in cell wall biosynthesis
VNRIPVLYLAPWVDYGGSDKGTIDWFRWIDRERFAPSLFTTQPSGNGRLGEVHPFAEEVWPLTELFPGERFPQAILDFISSRDVQLIHVMNSRLGFDLLPDIRALPRPPKVVVQLHVEEHTRDGYVRYVTTRYGNLVDAFSVTSEHLAEAVHGYGISKDRIVVIPTGVDAEDEFSPDRVTPRPGLEPGPVHILYPGRLVPQKDPLLMVEVARQLRDRGLSFKVHVVGEGELESDVRALVTEAGLDAHIDFHPPASRLAPWYAATDLLLMTSVFEGVPYVVYESLAMAVPVVAPALAGNVELMGDTGGTLVADRTSAAAYADALEPLMTDAPLRTRVGEAGRALVRERYSLREMADRHAALYDTLLRTPAPRRVESTAEVLQDPEPTDDAPPEQLRFTSRPSRGFPLVSVLTPCFNHGPWLRECVASVMAQTYPALEMIVVDDGSTDSETVAVLDELAHEERVTVIRMDRNSGPAAARNRGLEHVSGRYILPMDSDNLLEPQAVERLVIQLQGCGERVGYVYPTIEYFGNREDLFEAPAFNEWLLTRGNYIDTCALIDREVFDHGIRYAEDIVLGHEDWDFFLSLAAAGVQGEPGRGTSLLYRKHGFTRSDLVESAGPETEERVLRRHRLAAARGASKAKWAPALTLVTLGACRMDDPSWAVVDAGLARQRFIDFELFAAVDREPRSSAGPPVRQIPLRLQANRGQALTHVLEITEAPLVVVTYGTGAELLSDPGSLDRLVRVLEQGENSGLVALADAGEAGRFPWRVIPGGLTGLELHTFGWSRRHRVHERLPVSLDNDDPLGDLARWQQLRRFSIEWYHLPSRHRPSRSPGQGLPAGTRVPLVKVPRSRSELSERHSRRNAPTVLPGPGSPPARLEALTSWSPPSAVRLYRHRQVEGPGWTFTNSKFPPAGSELDRCLGSVHWMSLAGTARLVRDPAQGYSLVRLGTSPDAVELERTLGYVEQVAFPGLEPLRLCAHAETGENVLVCGHDDPLNAEVLWPETAVLGWVERVPINPQDVPKSGETRMWLRGIVRTVDLDARRHRVAVGAIPAGRGAWELGAALDRDPGNGIPVWADERGRFHAGSYVPSRYPLSPKRILRWTAAPMGWRGFGQPVQRARATARRTADAGLAVLRAGSSETAPSSRTGASAPPQGWLLPEDGPHRVAIYSAIHPVTSDQLLTRDPGEPQELGYDVVRMLGYAVAVPVVTESLARPSSAVPWASRFGVARTHNRDPVAG